MNLKPLVEAVIFASKGIGLKKLSRLLNLDEESLSEILESIKEEYSSPDHGIELREIDGEYRFYTKAELGEKIGRILGRNFTKLTASQLEIVVIIVMNGPLTKAEIDEIRGKDSSNLIRTLHRMGVLRRRRRGRRITYDLSKGFKESSMYEEIKKMLRGEGDG